MVGKCLAFVAFWWCLTGSDCGFGEEAGASLASESSKEEATCENLYSKCSSFSIWKRDQEESEGINLFAGAASYLQFSRISFCDTELHQYDLVLPNMQNQQWTEEYSLQTMLCPLDRSVADAEAQIKVQKPKGAEESLKRDDIRDGVMGSLSREGSLGCEYAYDEDQCKSGGGEQCITQGDGVASPTGVATSTNGSRECQSHGEREQKAAISSQLRIYGDGIGRRNDEAVGAAHSQRANGGFSKGAHTWSFESVAQIEKSGQCIRQKGSGLRQGMDSLYYQYSDQSEGTCSDVSKLSCRFVGSTQPEDCRTFGGQKGDERSIHVTSGSSSACSRDPGDARSCGRYFSSAGSYARGGRCRANRFDRRDGRGWIGGFRSNWNHSENCVQGAQAFQGSDFPYKSSKSPFENQDRIEGLQEGGQMSVDMARCHNKSYSSVGPSEFFVQNTYEQVRQALCSFVQNFDLQNVTWGKHCRGADGGSHASFSDEGGLDIHMGVIVNDESGDKTKLHSDDDPDSQAVLISNGAYPSEYLAQSDVFHHRELEPHDFRAGAFVMNGNRCDGIDLGLDFEQCAPSWCKLSLTSHCLSQKAQGRVSKKTRFHDVIDVHLYQGVKSLQFSLHEGCAYDQLRHFWHLDGQITNWDEITLTASRSHVYGSDAASLATRSESHRDRPSAVTKQDTAFNFESPETGALWWSDITLQCEQQEHSKPLFVATWFLSCDRFPLCIRSRRVQVSHKTSFVSFEQSCRQAWNELDNGDPFHFFLVEGKPPGMPSTIAHVIILQGQWNAHNAILLKSRSLPPLFSVRAVLFQQGVTVADIFRIAQFPFACTANRFMCCLSLPQDRMQRRLADFDQADVPMASYAIGEICPLVEEDGDSSSADESTDVPDESDVNALLSGGVHTFQDKREGNGLQWSWVSGSEQIEYASTDGDEGNSDLIWSWEVHNDGRSQNALLIDGSDPNLPEVSAHERNCIAQSDSAYTSWQSVVDTSTTHVEQQAEIAEGFESIQMIGPSSSSCNDWKALLRDSSQGNSDLTMSQGKAHLTNSPSQSEQRSEIAYASDQASFSCIGGIWPSQDEVNVQHCSTCVSTDVGSEDSDLWCSDEEAPAWCKWARMKGGSHVEMSPLLHDGRSEGHTHSDEISLMSAHPVLNPLDLLPMPWEDLQENAGVDVEIAIHFSPQQLQLVQDHIERILADGEEGQRNEQWTAVTFGLGLVDLGRRDMPNMENFLCFLSRHNRWT